MAQTFLDSEKLYEVASDLGFTALDIGARHNFIVDLLPLAPHVKAIGFDADKEEAARLNEVNKSGDYPWKSLRFIPVALAKDFGERNFYLYKQRGCSSLLKAIDGFGVQFGRGDYYIEDKTVKVETSPLGAASKEHSFEDVSYMKIDVEGAEIEIFENAEDLLKDSFLCIRTEASFAASHHNQPMYCDVEQHLRQYDFLPFSFVEMHHWRCFTKDKTLLDEKCKFPYSQAQMIHGDMLFFKDFEKMPLETDDDIKQHIRLAIYALVYGFIDHASVVMNQKEVSNYLKEKFNIDNIDDEILKVSLKFAKEYKAGTNRQFLRDVKKKVKTGLGLSK